MPFQHPNYPIRSPPPTISPAAICPIPLRPLPIEAPCLLFLLRCKYYLSWPDTGKLMSTWFGKDWSQLELMMLMMEFVDKLNWHAIVKGSAEWAQTIEGEEKRYGIEYVANMVGVALVPRQSSEACQAYEIAVERARQESQTRR